MKPTTARTMTTTLMAAALLGLAGCGGGGDSPSSAPGQAGDAATKGEAVAAPPGGGPAAPPGGGRAAPPLGRDDAAPTAVIRRAELRIEAADVAGAVAAAGRVVAAAGGFVANEQTTIGAGGSGDSAELVARIPTDRYDETLRRLAADVGRRRELRQHSEDVGQVVADVDSRVRSAQAALSRLRALMARAGTVGEVLSVSTEIDNRQADLEALQARQRALRAQTAYATVTVRISPPGTAIGGSAPGLGEALSDGWRVFTRVMYAIVIAAGYLLPFAVLAAVVIVPVWLVRRRRPPGPGEPAGRSPAAG